MRNNGKLADALANNKSSNEPPKYLPSVSTDIPLTPAFSYPEATSCTLRLLLITDLLGERLLCSAIMPDPSFKAVANDVVFLSKSIDCSN